MTLNAITQVHPAAGRQARQRSTAEKPLPAASNGDVTKDVFTFLRFDRIGGVSAACIPF
jgi:hypothetical protein